MQTAARFPMLWLAHSTDHAPNFCALQFPWICTQQPYSIQTKGLKVLEQWGTSGCVHGFNAQIQFMDLFRGFNQWIQSMEFFHKYLMDLIHGFKTWTYSMDLI